MGSPVRGSPEAFSTSAASASASSGVPISTPVAKAAGTVFGNIAATVSGAGANAAAMMRGAAVNVGSAVQGAANTTAAAAAVAASKLSSGTKAAFAAAHKVLVAAWNNVVAPTIAAIGTVGKAAFNVIKGTATAALFPLILLGRAFVELASRALALVKGKLADHKPFDAKAFFNDAGIVENFLSPKNIKADFHSMLEYLKTKPKAEHKEEEEAASDAVTSLLHVADAVTGANGAGSAERK